MSQHDIPVEGKPYVIMRETPMPVTIECLEEAGYFCEHFDEIIETGGHDIVVQLSNGKAVLTVLCPKCDEQLRREL